MSVVEPRSVPAHAAPSQQSVLALSWLNFFLSGMQTAFGPIVAAYLVVQGWRAEDIGFALSIGGRSQVPGGELVDSVRAKRLLVAAGVVAVALSVLIPLALVQLSARRPRRSLAGNHRRCARAGGGCNKSCTGRPRRPVGTARTEPALCSRRARRNGIRLEIAASSIQQPSCERTSMCGVVDCCTLCIDMNCSRESCTS